MYASKVDFSAPITHVAFSGEGRNERCLALLSDGTWHGLEYRGKEAELGPERAWSCNLGTLSARQPILLTNNIVIGLNWNAETDSDELVGFNASTEGSGLLFKMVFPGRFAARLIQHPTFGTVLVEMADGEVLEVILKQENNSIVISSIEPFPPCSRLSAASISLDIVGLHSAEGAIKIGLVSLDSRNRLSLNGRIIGSDVNSFFCHSDFLIFTTISNRAKFLPLLATEGGSADSTAASGGLLEEVSRRIERGSHIVTALHGGQSLILQMPRGNLETIYPRPLVLTTVKMHLDR